MSTIQSMRIQICQEQKVAFCASLSLSLFKIFKFFNYFNAASDVCCHFDARLIDMKRDVEKNLICKDARHRCHRFFTRESPVENL